MRIYVILALSVALVSPAIAASTPGELIQELAQAAHNKDVNSFLANMSADTQRAMADADAASLKLSQAQRDFLTALNEHFGEGLRDRPQPMPIVIIDRKTTLSRCVNVELINVEQKTPTEAQLRLKTTSKISGSRTATERTTTEEGTISAVVESGEWKLELTDLTRGQIRGAVRQTAAITQASQEVRSGLFKDRNSASKMLLTTLRHQFGSSAALI
jgi:hypothetical protein